MRRPKAAAPILLGLLLRLLLGLLLGPLLGLLMGLLLGLPLGLLLGLMLKLLLGLLGCTTHALMKTRLAKPEFLIFSDCFKSCFDTARL